MLLVKSDERTEAGAPPDPTFMSALGNYTEELRKTGKLLAAERLHPSAKGARFRVAGDERNLTKGPFGVPDKLIAGYWIINVESKEEAIEWAKRVPFDADWTWMANGGTRQVEVRQVFEPDDFPVNEDESGWREQEEEIRAASADGASYAIPQPVTGGPPLKRYFCIGNPDSASEAGVLPTEEALAAVGEFMGEMAASGALLGGEGLHPTSKGSRVIFSPGTTLVTDGPFLETKELVGGFAIMQMASLDEAIDLSWRFLEVCGPGSDGEATCEIREIIEDPAEVISQASPVFATEHV